MRILVVVAHPDDEILGCGGTIARHVNEGDIVDILIIGDGVTARYTEEDFNKSQVINEINQIKLDAEEASKIIKVNKLEIVGKNCCRFDKIPILNIIKIIEKKIDDYKPDRIYTHNFSDANIDHGIISKATQIATRPFPDQCVKEVFLMEILSSTEWNFSSCFRPNFYVDITKTIDKKIEALNKYSGELSAFPYPRSEQAILSLAKKRGSEVGLKNAEAFVLLRSIQK